MPGINVIRFMPVSNSLSGGKYNRLFVVLFVKPVYLANSFIHLLTKGHVAPFIYTFQHLQGYSQCLTIS